MQQRQKDRLFCCWALAMQSTFLSEASPVKQFYFVGRNVIIVVAVLALSTNEAEMSGAKAQAGGWAACRLKSLDCQSRSVFPYFFPHSFLLCFALPSFPPQRSREVKQWLNFAALSVFQDLSSMVLFFVLASFQFVWGLFHLVLCSKRPRDLNWFFMRKQNLPTIMSMLQFCLVLKHAQSFRVKSL